MYEIKKSTIKGKGVYATRDIVKNEHLFHVDLNQLPNYTLDEIAKNSILNANSDHSDYFGNGRYVIDLSPASYINHSCSPNCYEKMKTITIKDIYALRDIKKGEELTIDVTLTAVDQFAGKGFWVMDCKCGSKNCRGMVTGDFFTLPNELQRNFYRNLPPSVIKKYKDRFNELINQK